MLKRLHMSSAVQPNYTKIYLIFFESRVKRHPVKCQYIGVFFATAAKAASKEEVVVWCAQTYEGYNRVNVLAYCVQLNCNLRFLSCCRGGWRFRQRYLLKSNSFKYSI